MPPFIFQNGQRRKLIWETFLSLYSMPLPDWRIGLTADRHVYNRQMSGWYKRCNAAATAAFSHGGACCNRTQRKIYGYFRLRTRAFL